MPGVLNVHHAHAWALTTGQNIVSMHVLVDGSVSPASLQREIFQLLSDRFGVYFSTVQLEEECLESAAAATIDYSSRAVSQSE